MPRHLGVANVHRACGQASSQPLGPDVFSHLMQPPYIPPAPTRRK